MEPLEENMGRWVRIVFVAFTGQRGGDSGTGLGGGARSSASATGSAGFCGAGIDLPGLLMVPEDFCSPRTDGLVRVAHPACSFSIGFRCGL